MYELQLVRCHSTGLVKLKYAYGENVKMNLLLIPDLYQIYTEIKL